VQTFPVLARLSTAIGPRVGPLALSAVLTCLLTLVLAWPMPAELGSRTLVGPFHDGHVWCFWQMKQILLGDAAFLTSSIGWPGTVRAQLIGWGPGVLVAPLQGMLGPVGAYNFSLLLTGVLNAIFGGLLCIVLGARPWSAAAGGLILALCPYALDALANGQVVKLQIWILVLHLLAVHWSIRGWWRLPLVVLASLLLAFTSPSLAMSLPFALAVLVPAWVFSSSRRISAAVTGTLAIAATGASLVWASKVYDLDPSKARQSAFFPANVAEGDYHALLEQIARIDSVFLGGVPQGFHADHVPYLGLLAVIIGVACSLRSFSGRITGWVLLILGITLALGPRLADGSGFVMMGGEMVAMPAALLERVDYPIVRSGMYHRFLVLASLGLAILVACGSSARDKYGGRIAWICAAVLIGDALYQSKDRWPLQTQPVHGLSAYAEMAEDPEPGAVVVFPLRISDTGGGTQIMLSTFHGRPTTGLPRYDYWERSDAPGELLRIFSEAAEPGTYAPSSLADEGIRYVLWAPWIPHRDKDAITLEELRELLGPPQEDGELRWWRIESE
jgi:hypothetical protein